MKTPDYPRGPVLTIGMVFEKDRQEIVKGLQEAHQITLCIDNECYDVRTVAKYQFGKPEYVRHANIQSSTRSNQNT